MRFTLLRCPAVDLLLALFGLLKDGKLRAFNFLAVARICLIDIELDRVICYEIDFVAVLVLRRFEIAFNRSVFFDLDLDVCRDLAVTNRCVLLAKNVGLACLQLLAEVMRFTLLRCPVVDLLLALFGLLKDSKLRAFDFFAVACICFVNVEMNFN